MIAQKCLWVRRGYAQKYRKIEKTEYTNNLFTNMASVILRVAKSKESKLKT